MGAASFQNGAWLPKGKTVQEVFWGVVQRAQHEYGHGGYTGTIAEKGSVVLRVEAPFTDREEVLAFMDSDLEEADKYGPAHAVLYEHADGRVRVLFYGWARE